jgi:hypothetical protein
VSEAVQVLPTRRANYYIDLSNLVKGTSKARVDATHLSYLTIMWRSLVDFDRGERCVCPPCMSLYLPILFDLD